jgi:hypothetical protein
MLLVVLLPKKVHLKKVTDHKLTIGSAKALPFSFQGISFVRFVLMLIVGTDCTQGFSRTDDVDPLGHPIHSYGKEFPVYI